MFGFGLILFLLHPFSLSRILRLGRLAFWLNLILFFCRSGHLVVTLDQFLNFVGHLLPQEPYLELPRITGGELAGGGSCQKVYCWWVGWLGLDEIKALPLP